MAGEEASFKAEVAKLNQIISEAEAERLKQQKEFDIVVNERDILGTQVCAAHLAALPPIDLPFLPTDLPFLPTDQRRPSF